MEVIPPRIFFVFRMFSLTFFEYIHNILFSYCDLEFKWKSIGEGNYKYKKAIRISCRNWSMVLSNGFRKAPLWATNFVQLLVLSNRFDMSFCGIAKEFPPYRVRVSLFQSSERQIEFVYWFKLIQWWWKRIGRMLMVFIFIIRKIIWTKLTQIYYKFRKIFGSFDWIWNVVSKYSTKKCRDAKATCLVFRKHWRKIEEAL